MTPVTLHLRLNRLFCTVALGLILPSVSFAAGTSDDYYAAKDQAAKDYNAARARCDQLAGNAKDVCVAEAKAQEKKVEASAEAQYKNTDKAIRDARIATAEADYDVAKTKCGALAGNEKDVCVKEAQAAETKAKADAKATQKVAAAREDAAEDKCDANYKVAIEKCDALSGAAKDSCVADAKARYGK